MAYYTFKDENHRVLRNTGEFEVVRIGEKVVLDGYLWSIKDIVHVTGAITDVHLVWISQWTR